MYDMIINMLTYICTGIDVDATLTLHEFMTWLIVKNRIEYVVSGAINTIIVATIGFAIAMIIYYVIKNKKYA